MLAGRPTDYREEFCDKVVELGREGKTIAEMAAALDVNRATVKDWTTKYPAFSSAVKLGLELAQAWWEKKGRDATFGAHPGFNATSYIFQMKNRFKEDWRDRVDHEVAGPNGGPIQHEVTIDPSKLSTEALREIAAASADKR